MFAAIERAIGLERLGWPANQFEGAKASRIVPTIHPIAANLTVGVVCVKGCCGDSLSIDGPAPALVVPDEFSPASAHGSHSHGQAGAQHSQSPITAEGGGGDDDIPHRQCVRKTTEKCNLGHTCRAAPMAFWQCHYLSKWHAPSSWRQSSGSIDLDQCAATRRIL